MMIKIADIFRNRINFYHISERIATKQPDIFRNRTFSLHISERIGNGSFLHPSRYYDAELVANSNRLPETHIDEHIYPNFQVIFPLYAAFHIARSFIAITSRLNKIHFKMSGVDVG